MLPQPHRMRNSEEFRATVKRGARIGRPALVLHASRVEGDADIRVGFVVSKAVGNAVTRNRVKRRLRHLVAAELASTPPGSRMVVRALPKAALPQVDIGSDLHRAWSAAVRRTAGQR